MTWPKLAGSTRSTARSLPRLLLVQVEQELSSTTSCSPKRWRIWCNRSRRWTTHPPLRTRQSVSPSRPLLGVTEYWPANGPSRSPCRCQWDLDARKSNSNGPGLQRRRPPIWSWHGWSGCEQQKLRGVGSTIFAGPNAGLFWGGAKVWSSSTFPSARPRGTTRGDTAAKRPQPGLPFVAWWRKRSAVWPDGGRGELRRARRNSQSTCAPQSRYPILAAGIQAGIFRHKKLWHIPCAKLQPVGIGPPRSQGLWFSSSFTHSKQSTLRQRIRHAAGGGEGGLPGFCGSSAWFLQGWPRFRRWRGAGWAAAPGQPNGDVAAALAGSAQSQCKAAGRPGGRGRALAKTFTRRGRQCVQDIQAHSRFGPRLHQPQGNLAAASRVARAVHRFAHGVRGKAGQTFELVSHDGVEAQAIWRSSHNRPHGGSAAGTVAASKAACAAVGERARCALLLGLPRQSLRPSSLGALDRGGGSEGAAAVGGLPATGLGQVLRARRARPPLGRRPQNQFPHTTFGLLVRFVRRLAFSRGR